MSNTKLKLLTIPLDGAEVRESEMAWGIKIENEMQFFPKSQIQDFTWKDDACSFWCPEWLIEAKGVEDFVDSSYEPSLFDMK